MILTFIQSIELFLGNSYFLLCAITGASILKFFFLAYLCSHITRMEKRSSISALLLVGFLIGGLISDIAWVLKLLSVTIYTSFNPGIFIYIAWAFPVLQYQSLAFFIESLIQPNLRMNIRRGTSLFLSGLFFTFFISVALIKLLGVVNLDSSTRLMAQKTCAIYCFAIVLFTIFVYVYFKSKASSIPRLIKKQLSIILSACVFPQLFFDFIQLYPFNFSTSYITSSYAVVGLSAIKSTFLIYYCARRVLGLRFLNLKDHVESKARVNFINNFKDTLDQLSMVTTPKELTHITQTFFKENFNIPINRVTLHIRHDSVGRHAELNKAETTLETFLGMHPTTASLLEQHGPLLADEIEFNSFYESDKEKNILYQMIKTLEADIFVPIYKNNVLIAYIFVDRYARPHTFYTKSERNEMAVFANYIGNIIYLMKNRQLESLIQKEKELKEELYHKHQEINQYKESIRSFLRINKSKEIGIIFYKNRKFTFANQSAKELININLNSLEGHPLTKTIKQLATQVEEYKAPQTTIYIDSEGNKMVISAVNNLEKNNIIITVYPPDISDIVKRQIDLLRDPSKWDYLLYLESTKSGQLVNQLIPGSGETLLNFKINLLKATLSRQALMIEAPNEDLEHLIEIIHHLSLREKLHTIRLNGQDTNNATPAIEIFGVNSIFNNGQSRKGLLEKLDNIGTLFIENVHLLDMETQEQLAEYLKYGVFRVFKSDQKITSSVRIICSSNQNLQLRAHEGSFSANLLAELKKCTLSMPSLLTLPLEEFDTLTEGITQITLQKKDATQLVELNDRDKSKLAQSRPVSLVELKTRIHQLIAGKTKATNPEIEGLDGHHQPSINPDLIQAARLGKQALRDEKIMLMLWDKFKNQNKIAAFIGVNRSSVNRRLREFGVE